MNRDVEDAKAKLNPYNLSNKLVTRDDIQNILKQEGVDDSLIDLSIYQRAFVHKSYIKKECTGSNDENSELCEKPDDALELQDYSNERLEYLGDSVINFIVAKYVYDRFPNEEEGFLTRLRTKVVCGESLANLARKIGFSKHLIISRHVEEKCNGRDNMRILEDAFESFFGAILLDFNKISINKVNNLLSIENKLKDLKKIKGDLSKSTKSKNLLLIIESLEIKINEIEKDLKKLTQKESELEDEIFSGIGFQIAELFMINIMEKYIYWPDLILKDNNYKDQLLRYFQQKYQSTPKYQEQSIDGPPHKRTFTMSVLDIEGNIVGIGKERSKKKAEQLASKEALIKYCVINEND